MTTSKRASRTLCGERALGVRCCLGVGHVGPCDPKPESGMTSSEQARADALASEIRECPGFPKYVVTSDGVVARSGSVDSIGRKVKRGPLKPDRDEAFARFREDAEQFLADAAAADIHSSDVDPGDES